MFDLPEITRANMREMLVWWLLVFGILAVFQWRNKNASGLPLAYAFNLSMIHATGAFIYCFDYYTPLHPSLIQMEHSFKNSFTGFHVALIGFIFFVIGAMAPPIVLRFRQAGPVKPVHPSVSSKMPGTLLIVSAIFFVFLARVLAMIPSLTSISSAGVSLCVVAFNLYLVRNFNFGRYAACAKWILLSCFLPFITVITMGFASYGSNAATMIWLLFFRVLKPRWLGVLLLSGMLYFGLTMYVNYMRERWGIREKVWGNSGLSARVDTAMRIFKDFAFFNSYDQGHLELIDLRLNQNEPVGKAVANLAAGNVGFAEGGTLAAAAVAWVPRILWPGKPSTGGSGSLVSRFTGQKFQAGTSVGVGQVLELYCNWGITSVTIGFFIFGFCLSCLDQKAGYYLRMGDNWRFTCWLLPGIGMINAIGSSTEIVSSVAANTVFVYVLHQVLFAKYYEETDKFRSNRGSGLDRRGEVRGSKFQHQSP